MRCELGQLCSSLRLKTLQAAKAYSRVQTGSFRPGHDYVTLNFESTEAGLFFLYSELLRIV